MKNSIQSLLNNFNSIKNKGYIESVTNNKNGSGITLEKLLKIESNNFNFPDYEGIEIKAIRPYKFATMNMFSYSPESNYLYPVQWLAHTYGTRDLVFENIHKFQGFVYANKYSKIGNKALFKLEIDEREKKILLNIYDKNYNLLNNNIHWDFEEIEEKLKRKFKFLAIFDTSSYKKNNKYYYKYTNIHIYKLKSFDFFIQSLKKGKIFICFSAGAHKSGYLKGKFNDHGTAFRINKNDLELIFDKVI